MFLKLCSFTWMVLERNVIFWLVKQLHKKHLHDIRHSVHDAAVNIICLLYHLYILLWFASNLNLDPDMIINQSSPSSAAAGWKVCLWAFASVYRLDQSPKNTKQNQRKTRFHSGSCLDMPWFLTDICRNLRYTINCVWDVFSGFSFESVSCSKIQHSQKIGWKVCGRPFCDEVLVENNMNNEN